MCQFRFLIVEDEPHTLDQLKSLIAEEFPQSTIDAAETVHEGRRHLQSAGAEALPYDAVILDFRLPQESGDQPEVDTSLTREAQRAGHRVLIAQITSYTMDKTVERHIKETQIEKPNPNSFLISKRESAWSARLMTKLRMFLYSGMVQRELEEIFGEPAPRYARGRGRSRGRGGIPGGMTHRLATLCRLVEAHWDDLEGEVQQNIRDILEVDESSTKPKVGLLLEDPWIKRNLPKPSNDSP